MKLFVIVAMVTSMLCEGQQSWYQTVRFVERDPYAFNRTYRGILFPGTGYKLLGRPASGHVYVVLKRSEYDVIWTAPNHQKTMHERVVTATEASTFASHLRAHGTPVKVPTWISAVGLFPSTVLQLVGAGTTILDIALSAFGSGAADQSAAELAATMAPGGVFREIASLRRESTGKDFFTLSLTYSVRVGNQLRSTVVASSSYALKIE